jgi:hypothetical protein
MKEQESKLNVNLTIPSSDILIDGGMVDAKTKLIDEESIMGTKKLDANKANGDRLYNRREEYKEILGSIRKSQNL